jgi:proteasome alpha subunit
VVLSYEGGVLFVAENLSTALHKVSEIYDKIGFAAVGRYPEFENLRSAGVRLADLHGYSYGRRDVTGRQVANAYARTLGAIFTQEQKPYEVEICVAEVGATAEDDELYRITYDGSVQDEPGLVTMGGQSDTISGAVKTRLRPDQTLAEALKLAVEGLNSVGGENGQPRKLAANQLEVAVLDRHRQGRTFRRLTFADSGDAYLFNNSVMALAFTAFGALVLTYRPGHRIGRLFVVYGLCYAASLAALGLLSGWLTLTPGTTTPDTQPPVPPENPS